MRKNRRPNELKTSLEYLTVEGRTVKHHALIDHFANLNINKLADSPIDLVGLDIETEPQTGEMRMMGWYEPIDDETPQYWLQEGIGGVYDDPSLFVGILFQRLKWCWKKSYSIAFWNKLDPYQLLRLLILHAGNQVDETNVMNRYGKVGGIWDKKKQEWEIKPVITIKNDLFEFGILSAIRSNIQFYFKLPQHDDIIKVWGYDISPFYKGTLGKVGTSKFTWYYKGDESLHKVDWVRYKTDLVYQKEVKASNMRDARVAMALGYGMQEEFAKAYYGNYSKSIISQGAFARSAIVAVTKKRLEDQGFAGDALKHHLYEEISSIGIMYYYDKWAEQYGHDFLKDFLCLISEVYSGGEIEATRYGYAEVGCYADLAAAYPSIIQKLEDLRDCEIETGVGTPPTPNHGYMFIRGTVNIPKDLVYHPITIKSPLAKETNIRPTGTFKASYLYDERALCSEYGATFENEKWYWVKTKGKRSPLGFMIDVNNELRDELKALKDPSEVRVKEVSASAYGITYECVDTYVEVSEKKILTETYPNEYREVLDRYRQKIKFDSVEKGLKHILDKDFYAFKKRWASSTNGMSPDVVAEELKSMGVFIEEENSEDIMLKIDELYRKKPLTHINSFMQDVVKRNGYRAGEFYNPLVASIITARVRCILSKAAMEIEKQKGKVILLMTDSITWQGLPTLLPEKINLSFGESGVKKEKTIGYFEPPDIVTDVVCLGSGRYGFKGKTSDDDANKRRGLNIVGYTETYGISVEKRFNWMDVLKMVQQRNTLKLGLNVRVLTSPSMCAHRGNMRASDLGKIIEEPRNVEVIAGHNKRIYSDEVRNPQKLATQLCDTMPYFLDPYMFGEYKLVDGTLPELRHLLMSKAVETRKERKKKNSRNTSLTYYHGSFKENGKNTKVNKTRKDKYQQLIAFGIGRTLAKDLSSKSWVNIKEFLSEKGWLDAFENKLL